MTTSEKIGRILSAIIATLSILGAVGVWMVAGFGTMVLAIIGTIALTGVTLMMLGLFARIWSPRGSDRRSPYGTG